MLAGIFALGIGAAGGVAGSSSGSRIRGQPGRLDRLQPDPQQHPGSGQQRQHPDDDDRQRRGDQRHCATDDSWINSTAGAVAVSIAVSQKTAVAAALGLSLTINEIHNTTRAGGRGLGRSTPTAPSRVSADERLADRLARLRHRGRRRRSAATPPRSASARPVPSASTRSTTSSTATIANTATNGTATVTAGGSGPFTSCHGTPVTKSIVVAGVRRLDDQGDRRRGGRERRGQHERDGRLGRRSAWPWRTTRSRRRSRRASSTCRASCPTAASS